MNLCYQPVTVLQTLTIGTSTRTSFILTTPLVPSAIPLSQPSVITREDQSIASESAGQGLDSAAPSPSFQAETLNRGAASTANPPNPHATEILTLTSHATVSGCASPFTNTKRLLTFLGSYKTSSSTSILRFQSWLILLLAVSLSSGFPLRDLSLPYWPSLHF